MQGKSPVAKVAAGCARIVFLQAAVCTLWSTPCIVSAHPTSTPLAGPTGLGTIPTAQTVPAGQFEVGLGYENVDPPFGRVSYLPTATATYGFARGEVGG